MKESKEDQYVKRTQRDRSYAFKLQVVQEIERGEENTTSAQRKYGIQARSTVVEMVRAIRERMPRLGARKLYVKLKDKLGPLGGTPLGVGRDRLFEILRANHLLISPKRQYHVTTDSHHRFRKHKNLVEDLEITRPEQVFVADITYIGERENPMYLSMVTDAYSKQIMGYDVSDSLAATGVITALQKALKNRKCKKNPLIHHSDRGHHGMEYNTVEMIISSC